MACFTRKDQSNTFKHLHLQDTTILDLILKVSILDLTIQSQSFKPSQSQSFYHQTGRSSNQRKTH